MPSRRQFLGTLGAASLSAASGCAAIDDLADPLRSHVLNEEAPVDAFEGPWPTHAADPGRTGAVSRSVPSEDALVHELSSVGRFAEAQPVVQGSRLYLGVDRRQFEDGEFTGLVAFDLDTERPGATVVWREPEGDAGLAFTPSVRGRVVYAQVGNGIKALDATAGDVYWRTTAGGGTPTVDGEDCFTTGDGVIALDAVTGETRWESEATEAAPSGFAVTEDAVCLACGDGGDGSLWAFERTDGSTRWRYTDLGESYATAVTDGERVYAVSTSGRLHAVGLADGDRRWTHRVEGESYIQPAVADGTVFLAGTNSDRLVALDAATGETVWKRTIGIGGSSPPAVTAETVVVETGTREGRRLFVLDRRDGTERTRFELPDGMYGSVQPVVGDGVVYVVAEPRMAHQWSLYAVR